MPKALPKDVRYLVQSLILQGLKPKTVAEKTGVNQGTIKTLANRHGWTRMANKTKEILIRDGTHDLAMQAATASQQVRNSLSRSLKEATEALEKMPKSKRNIDQLIKVADAAERMTRTGDKLYAWSEGQEQTLISINVLANLSELPNKPVIEIGEGKSMLIPEGGGGEE